MNRGILRVPLMYQSADLLFFALLPTQARELTKQLRAYKNLLYSSFCL